MLDYKIKYVTKENVLNKILKHHKTTREPFSLLFVSLWDPRCIALMNILKKKCSKATEESTPLWIVDSFNTPHSFVIFKVKTAPFLIVSKENKRGVELEMEGYLPRILDHFSISKFIIPEQGL